ncbi:hypothetical protein ABZ621_02690 [Streptomyces sp. NPDC007863]|uniref:hypothetical protein n=1 Tax=Streptomyces sp. NPDC007863 TaxID=3154894 RepID=UPI0033C60EDE
MRGKRRAATTALTAVLALGAAGCWAAADEAPEAAPVPPRPAGSGPLTKDVVRADVDGAVRAADAPPGLPDQAGPGDRDPAGCTIVYRGFAEKDVPADITRYEALKDALRARAWTYVRKGPGQDERGGEVHHAQEIFKQRGWTLVTTYYQGVEKEDDQIGVLALDDVCAKKSGLGQGAVG